MDSSAIITIALLMAAGTALYSSVGHGGASDEGVGIDQHFLRGQDIWLGGWAFMINLFSCSNAPAISDARSAPRPAARSSTKHL